MRVFPHSLCHDIVAENEFFFVCRAPRAMYICIKKCYLFLLYSVYFLPSRRVHGVRFDNVYEKKCT